MTPGKNRIIKFRGKSINSGNWVYGDLIHSLGGKKCFIQYWEDNDTSGNVKKVCIPVISGSVGQLVLSRQISRQILKTQEPDIYENDIVTYCGNTFIIQHSERDGNWYLAKIFKDIDFPDEPSIPQTHFNMPVDGLFLKIIGNTAENPALINQTK